MKRLITATALSLVMTSLVAGAATAQQMPPPHEQGRDAPGRDGPSHHDWRKGGRIERDDWNRGHQVDYRKHHLRKPPRGYEWREVDGNYILAAVATGLITSVILNGH